MMVLIPLQTSRGLNAREHHMARHRRVKAEREAVAWVCKPHQPPAGPVVVTLWRVSPGPNLLDKDNLQGALKAVRDEVAAWLKRDDADDSIDWRYAQRGGKPGEWKVGIEVSAAAAQRLSQSDCIAACIGESCSLCGAHPGAESRNGGTVVAKDIDHADPLIVESLGSREECDPTGVNRRLHSNILITSLNERNKAEP